MFDLSSCEVIDEHQKAHESSIYSLVGFEEVDKFFCYLCIIFYRKELFHVVLIRRLVFGLMK